MTKTIPPKLCINCKHIKFDHLIAAGSKCMHPKLVREETIKNWVNGTEKSCKRSPYCDYVNTDGKCKFFEEKPKPKSILGSVWWNTTFGMLSILMAGVVGMPSLPVDIIWIPHAGLFVGLLLAGCRIIEKGYKIKYEVK